MICCQNEQSLIIYSSILKCLHNFSNVAINFLDCASNGVFHTPLTICLELCLPLQHHNTQGYPRSRHDHSYQCCRSEWTSDLAGDLQQTSTCGHGSRKCSADSIKGCGLVGGHYIDTGMTIWYWNDKGLLIWEEKQAATCCYEGKTNCIYLAPLWKNLIEPCLLHE